jgi:hypothetical protein
MSDIENTTRNSCQQKTDIFDSYARWWLLKLQISTAEGIFTDYRHAVISSAYLHLERFEVISMYLHSTYIWFMSGIKTIIGNSFSTMSLASVVDMDQMLTV